MPPLPQDLFLDLMQRCLTRTLFPDGSIDISIDTSTLDKGVYSLRLVGVTPEGKYYRSRSDICVLYSGIGTESRHAKQRGLLHHAERFRPCAR